MAIRIPERQASVDIRTPNVPTPQLAAPVRAAFGEDVARANQGIADQGTQIAQMFQKRAEEKRQLENQRHETELVSKYQMDKQDMLYSEEEEEIDIDGQKITRPKGFLNRQQGAAKGATVDFQTRSNEYVTNLLNDVKDPATRERLAARFSNDVITTRERIIKHEIAQDKDHKKGTATSAITIAKDYAAAAQNADELNIQIENALSAQDLINRTDGVDPTTAEVNNRGVVADVVESAVIGSFNVDPTGETAKALLEDAKENLSNEAYAEAKETIDATVQKKIAEGQKIQKLQQNAAADEMTGMIIDGTLSLANLEQFRGRATEKEYLSTKKSLMSPKSVDPRVKAQTYVDLQERFERFQIDKKNGKTTEATSIDDLAEFRVMVIDAHTNGEISESEMKGFLNKTAKAFDRKAAAATEKKKGWLTSLRDWADRNADEISEIKKDAMQKFEERTQNIENMTDEEIEVVRDGIIREEQAKINPNRNRYNLGQIVNTPGGSMEVVGFDDDGEPLVKRIN